MAETPDCPPTGRGLHPSHYAALRTEILRTGIELSDRQLRDIADALQIEVGLRRSRDPAGPLDSRAFA